MYVVELDPVWQNITAAAFVVIWVGGTLALFIRTYLRQRTYLRHFAEEYPFLAGEPLFDVPRTFRAYHIGTRLMHQPQSDPVLEQLRCEMWRRFRYFIVWLCGCPILFFGVAALLILTGAVRLAG